MSTTINNLNIPSINNLNIPSMETLMNKLNIQSINSLTQSLLQITSELIPSELIPSEINSKSQESISLKKSEDKTSSSINYGEQLYSSLYAKPSLPTISNVSIISEETKIGPVIPIVYTGSPPVINSEKPKSSYNIIFYLSIVVIVIILILFLIIVKSKLLKSTVVKPSKLPSTLTTSE